ncbi:2-polyprenyl-3-methyl-5-hydroxy-6-metoxy-1,4-benzoquinol methylase [Pelagirhabdus alkalitolerans]|uniref:2-polyprenyl-3-methyl-5-hydroxy-6-metoxy-1,4-benzoquinol methylase n=1 Tax=Pelagirhabdus alkalitolerans TaxID=1612202 RepID=A0A1G6KM79_9BACI|nr:class I SAM-dependent methyltransferase [Pelagirhabdus alkalitolerans]SDC32073.1 2-polyprenyl-3-methyl-5-hydroxy-6-metoxy-1,4-benzoquinol methylase [Pelagirhabdus alkalitolerans]
MIEDTGERVIPENMSITNELLIEHVARYHFAVSFIESGRVLDVASGAGFGTHIVAKKKKKQIEEVVGLDIDQEVLSYAKKTYYHPKSSFHYADVTDYESLKSFGLFDTIMSFETYEHVEAERAFLTNLYQLLKPGGRLILSTPFGQGRGKPCGSPFHVHQITPEEFHHLFDDFEFQSIDYYVQKGALIQREDEKHLAHYPLGIAVCHK